MNRKMFFDLDVDYKVFRDKVCSVICGDNLEFGVVYYVSVFVSAKEFACGGGSRRRCRARCRENGGLPDQACGLKWVKTIPFIIHKSEEIGMRLEKLFSDVFVSVSYTAVDLFCDSEGVAFNKTFCICIHKDVFRKGAYT